MELLQIRIPWLWFIQSITSINSPSFLKNVFYNARELLICKIYNVSMYNPAESMNLRKLGGVLLGAGGK